MHIGAGAKVGVLSRKAEKVEATVAELKAAGAEAFGGVADVRQYDAVAKVLAEARAALGPFAVLINGAAGNFPAPALGMSSNAFKAVMDIDTLGTFNGMRAGYEHLQKPGGCIINISAPQAWLPMALQMHVCAAKAGVDMCTRVAALEWGPAGVRVNGVIPGPIDGTEGMARLAPTEASRAAVMKSVPLGRYGTPDEVADCCLWLGSDMARYVSGAIIPVDGGWSLGGAAILGAMGG